MKPKEIDRIESAIRHIQTAVDVDPWAMEIAVAAMQEKISREPNEDVISRKAAKHALCKAVHKNEDIPCENQTASCLWSKTRVCDYAREIDALPSAQPDFDITVKIDKAYDDGYEAGYLQGRHDWGDLDE